MTGAKPDSVLLLFLRIGAFCCFVGWAWVHFYWEGPFGILLRRDGSYALAERFGIGWDEFVGTGAEDGTIQKWIARMAWPYLICCFLTLTVRKKSSVQMAILIGGSGLLVVLGTRLSALALECGSGLRACPNHRIPVWLCQDCPGGSL